MSVQKCTEVGIIVDKSGATIPPDHSGFPPEYFTIYKELLKYKENIENIENIQEHETGQNQGGRIRKCIASICK